MAVGEAEFFTPNWNGYGAYPGYRIPQGFDQDPSRGGIDFTGLQIPTHVDGANPAARTKLYLTLKGSGGASLTTKMGRSPMKFKAPTGYFPGWPTEDYSGYSAWNPDTSQGAAQDISGGEYVNFQPFTPGMVQSYDGHSSGNFYVEFTYQHTDFATTGCGIGVGRLMPDLTYWFGNAQFSATDANGGATTSGPSVSWNGNEGDPFLPEGLDVTIGVCISITPPPAVLIPQDFHPVSMKCIPCAPLTPAHATFRAFG